MTSGSPIANTEQDTTITPIELSIIAPALDEQDNVAPLVEQVAAAAQESGLTIELVVVDDGSTDQTLARLRSLQAQHPLLVVLHRDKPMGQSAAMAAGIAQAKGRYIATIDADLQNDPAELSAMLELLHKEGVDMVQGDRSHARQDNFVRKVGSKIGRMARRWLLNDPVRDTGCSARVMTAELAKSIPLTFKGMHRFFPAYARLTGARIAEMPVKHRPRTAGETKYGLGLLSRGPAGLVDCLAVRWMGKRYRPTDAQLVKPDPGDRERT